MKQEIWKKVVGFEEYYEVSNFGNVKSIRPIKSKYYKVGNRDNLLKPDSFGEYLRVTLSVNKIKKRVPVHVLVAIAFIENPLKKPEVNHIDTIKTHNWVENLEWVTTKENKEHAMQNGLIPKGINHKRAKLSEEDVRNIRLSNKSAWMLAKEYPVTAGAIDFIKTGKNWRHLK